MSGIEGGDEGGYSNFPKQRMGMRGEFIERFTDAGADLKGFRASTLTGLTKIERRQLLSLTLPITAKGPNFDIPDFYALLSEARIAARFSVDILRHLKAKDKDLVSEDDLKSSLKLENNVKDNNIYSGGQILSIFKKKNEEDKKQLKNNLLEIIKNTDDLLNKYIEFINTSKTATLQSATGTLAMDQIQEDGEGTPEAKSMTDRLRVMKDKLPTPDLIDGMRGVKQKASTMLPSTNPLKGKLRERKEKQLETAKKEDEDAIGRASGALEGKNDKKYDALKNDLNSTIELIKPIDFDIAASIKVEINNFVNVTKLANEIIKNISVIESEQDSGLNTIIISEAPKSKSSLFKSLKSNLPGALPSISNAAKGLYNRIPPLPSFSRKTPESLDDSSSPPPSESEINTVINQAKALEPEEISSYDVQTEYGECLLSIAQLKETVGASEKEAADMELAFALGALDKIKEDNLHEGLNNFNPLLEEASSLLKKEDATEKDVEDATTLTRFVVLNLIALSKVEAVKEYQYIVGAKYIIDPAKNDEINAEIAKYANILEDIKDPKYIKNAESFEDFMRNVDDVVETSDGILLRLKELKNSAEPIVAETASREESSDAAEETSPPSSMASSQWDQSQNNSSELSTEPKVKRRNLYRALPSNPLKNIASFAINSGANKETVPRGIAPFLKSLIGKGPKVESASPEQNKTTTSQKILIVPAAAVNDELSELRAKRAELSAELVQAEENLKNASKELSALMHGEEKSDDETEESLKVAVEKAKSEVGDLNELLQQTTVDLQNIEPKIDGSAAMPRTSGEAIKPLVNADVTGTVTSDPLKHIAYIVKELFSTEKTFLMALTMMKDMLSKNGDKDTGFSTTLDERKRQQLIDNINTWIFNADNYLMPKNTASLNDWGEVKKLFTELNSLFSNDSLFGGNLRDLFVSSSNIMTLEKNDEERNYGYRAVAITPVQRVTRYGLLFAEIAESIAEAKKNANEGSNADLTAVEDLNNKILSKFEGLAKKFNRLQLNNDLKGYLEGRKTNIIPVNTFMQRFTYVTPPELIKVFKQYLDSEKKRTVLGDESIKILKQGVAKLDELKNRFDGSEEELNLKKIDLTKQLTNSTSGSLATKKLQIKLNAVTNDLAKIEQQKHNIKVDRDFVSNVKEYYAEEIKKHDTIKEPSDAARRAPAVRNPWRGLTFLSNISGSSKVKDVATTPSTETFAIVDPNTTVDSAIPSATPNKTPVQILQDICKSNDIIHQNRDSAATKEYYLLDHTNASRVDIKVKDKDNSTNDTTALSVENKTDSNKMAAVTYDTKHGLLAVLMALRTADQMHLNNGKIYQITEPKITNEDEVKDYLVAVRNFCFEKTDGTNPRDASAEQLIAALKQYDIGILNPSAAFKDQIKAYLDSPSLPSSDDSSRNVREQNLKQAFKAYLNDPTSPKKGNQGMLAPKPILRRH